MKIVILGLSVTSSWGNGHATTYRSLILGLYGRGHDIRFLEREAPWYAGNRDEPNPSGARTDIYHSLDELVRRYEQIVSDADLVIVGSFVPDGVAVGEWVTSVATGVTAFYDIDTPITIEKIRLAAAGNEGACEYLTPSLIRSYDMYLSFTGGPLLKEIESGFGSPEARPLFCSVDPRKYFPVQREERWAMGYLGTYSEDRQPALESLMVGPARQLPSRAFAVAGPMYPESIDWPENVTRIIHLSPREHPGFYCEQRFTLNITRDAMKRAGYSPSVRLFEAGACGAPVISDWWHGLDTIFVPGKEVLLADSPEDVLRCLHDLTGDSAAGIGRAMRQRILNEHTSDKRAAQLEHYFEKAAERTGKKRAPASLRTVSA